MKKGIVVTVKNMATILDHLKKAMKGKSQIEGRYFYTRSMKLVNSLASCDRRKNSSIRDEQGKTLASVVMFEDAGATMSNRMGYPVIWLNSDDEGIYHIKSGDKVFISPTGRVFVEKKSCSTHPKKFIFCVS